MSASGARRTARNVLSRIRERDAYGHEVLSAALRETDMEPSDVAFTTRLVYGALQTVGTLDEALDRYLVGKRLEPRVRDALRIAAYELLFQRTEPRAAVHQGVELVREVRPQATGLANAVLRRLADEAPAFPWGDPACDDAALARLHGHPLWLASMWIRELGRDTAASVMAADNEPAPLFLAVNPFAGAFEDAVEVLLADGAQPEPVVPDGCLVARDAAAAVRGRALAEGLVVAADAAAQLVPVLAMAAQGQRIVEIGAGRGTKTMLLQAHAVATGGPAELIAVDVHEFKSRLLEERMSRLGVPGITALTLDATAFDDAPASPAPGTIDTCVIDAPCTGLGTLRRHPEKRWRVSEGDISSLSVLGARLLGSAASLVRAGGFVVYSTCTLSDAENRDLIDSFLASEGGRRFVLDPLEDEVPEVWRHWVAEGGYFRSLPQPGGPDGHFMVRLRRIE
jgi:16S rRNA (cytosine967-C5)-methyltransferase